MVLFLGIGPPFVNPGVCPSGQHLDSHQAGSSSQWAASVLLGGALPLSGSCPLGWGTALATVTTSPIFQGCVFLFPFCIFLWEQTLLFFPRVWFLGFSLPLGMLVAKWVPTPCYNDAYSVGTPKWAFREKGWLMHYKTTISPFLGRFFLVSKRTFFFFWWFLLWVLHIGRATHPGPGPRDFTLGQLSIDFANVGGWLTSGDLALDSCVGFRCSVPCCS